MEIIIENDQSYRYDLKNNIYTILRLMKSDTSISFTLTNNEHRQIVNKYYELNLDDIQGKVRINGTCSIMPQFFDVLTVHSKGEIQEIVIETGCKKYETRYLKEANKIQKFLEFIMSILQSKPEIKNAPESDVFYL